MTRDFGPLRLIVAGYGRVVERYHLPAIAATPGVRIVAVCEPDPARRLRARAMLPFARCETSLEAVLQAGVGEAVMIATPPATHGQLVESALNAGMAVLVEKPMTVTVEEAIRVRDLQRRTEAVLRVGFNRRYRTAYQRCRDRGASRLQQVEFTFLAERGRWGTAEERSHAFVLHDAGSHAVDLVAWAAGHPIERVRAIPREAGGDFAVALELQVSGGITASCLIGHSRRYREVLTIRATGDTCTVTASAGLTGRAMALLPRLTGRPTAAAESFRLEWAGFARAFRGEPDLEGADVDDGLAAVTAVEAALQSLAAKGEWCSVPNLPTKEDP